MMQTKIMEKTYTVRDLEALFFVFIFFLLKAANQVRKKKDHFWKVLFFQEVSSHHIIFQVVSNPKHIITC